MKNKVLFQTINETGGLLYFKNITCIINIKLKNILIMRTWLDKKTNQWVSERPEITWTGLVDINTGEKIFEDDTISIIDIFTYPIKNRERKIITLKLNDKHFNILACPEYYQDECKPTLIKKGDTK